MSSEDGITDGPAPKKMTLAVILVPKRSVCEII